MCFDNKIARPHRVNSGHRECALCWRVIGRARGRLLLQSHTQAYLLVAGPEAGRNSAHLYGPIGSLVRFA